MDIATALLLVAALEQAQPEHVPLDNQVQREEQQRQQQTSRARRMYERATRPIHEIRPRARNTRTQQPAQRGHNKSRN